MIFAFWLLTLAGTAAAPPAVSVSDLINRSSFYDAKEVVVEDEVVGDLMLRGEYGWVNISDGASAVGVYAPAKELQKVKVLGRYQTAGDKVQVTGTFYNACPIHYGETDIHAVRIAIIKRGVKKEEELDRNKLNLSLEIAFLVIVAFGLRQFFRKANGGRRR